LVDGLTEVRQLCANKWHRLSDVQRREGTGRTLNTCSRCRARIAKDSREHIPRQLPMFTTTAFYPFGSDE